MIESNMLNLTLEDNIDDGPEWASYTPLDSVKRRVAVRGLRDGPVKLSISIGGKRRYTDAGEHKLLDLTRMLIDAANALGMPDYVIATAIKMIEKTYTNYIWRHAPYIAAILRGATVLHAWPIYYREILDTLGLSDTNGRKLAGSFQLKLASWLGELWPRPRHWRAMARAITQRLASEARLPWNAAKLAGDLAEYLVSKRDGTRIETAAAAGTILSAQLWGIQPDKAYIAKLVGVSPPAISRAIKWIIENTTIRVYLG